MTKKRAVPRPPPGTKFISSVRERELSEFADRLVELCRRYNVTLVAEPGLPGSISVVDPDQPLPSGYEAIANFAGVDRKGLYNRMNVGNWRRPGLLIERMPGS